MNGKAAFVLVSCMLSGLLSACVPPAAAPGPAPAAPPPPVAAAPPPPAAEPAPGDRWVSIRAVTCERLTELASDDRAAAALFYLGYNAARLGSKTINVSSIPNAEAWAFNYCAEHPGRPAVIAFRLAYLHNLRR